MADIPKIKTEIVKNPISPRIRGKFAPGFSGCPTGRPPGKPNFMSDFDEVCEEVAKVKKITFSEARKGILRKAFLEAKKGNFPFYKDICDRYYGKPAENIDIKHDLGETLVEIIKNANTDKTRPGDISPESTIEPDLVLKNNPEPPALGQGGGDNGGDKGQSGGSGS